MRLIIKVNQQRNTLNSTVALQCCDELLSEDLEQGMMVCNHCGATYPLNTVRTLIDQAYTSLEDLSQALNLQD
jgi:hypothetical protein